VGIPQINTEFVYHAGSLLCCTEDEPFFLSDINDQDLVVGFGFDKGFGPLLALATDAEANIPLTFIGPMYGFSPSAPVTFYSAIDDQDRILAKMRGQDFILSPTPEPATVSLPITILVGCATIWLRRKKRSSLMEK
jgi:hypothetical protein